MRRCSSDSTLPIGRSRVAFLRSLLSTPTSKRARCFLLTSLAVIPNLSSNVRALCFLFEDRGEVRRCAAETAVEALPCEEKGGGEPIEGLTRTRTDRQEGSERGGFPLS